jgi:short-subunit dehydrogenase
MKKVVLITGASSGIGAAAAIQLIKDTQFEVYVTARNVQSLQSLAQLGCKAIALDVTDEESMRSAIQKIESETDGVDILINNAGFAQNGILEEMPLAIIRKQFETNVFGLIRMCQLVLPKMRQKQNGRIINIGSAGGDFTTPGVSAYHASKYAIESFTDGLRAEVRQFGIQVSLIKPGGVRTNFMNVADSLYPAAIEGNPYQLFRARFAELTVKIFDPKNKSYGVLTPETVAQAIYKAATATFPKTRYRIGGVAKVMPVVRRLMSDKAWDNLMLKQIGLK